MQSLIRFAYTVCVLAFKIATAPQVLLLSDTQADLLPLALRHMRWHELSKVRVGIYRI